MAKQEKLFSSSDLPLVAVLRMTKGIKFEGTSQETEKKLIFYFSPAKKAEEVSQKFYNRELKVEPFDYFQTIKSLKSLIYSELNRYNAY